VLGLALDSLGRYAEADSALRRSLEIRQRYMPPDHWALASSESVLGFHLARMGRFEEALPMLRAAYDKLVEQRGPEADVSLRAKKRIEDALGLRSKARL